MVRGVGEVGRWWLRSVLERMGWSGGAGQLRLSYVDTVRDKGSNEGEETRSKHFRFPEFKSKTLLVVPSLGFQLVFSAVKALSFSVYAVRE
ncbi:hypothetical protein Tco_0428315 [Tanacetum coccineum]